MHELTGASIKQSDEGFTGSCSTSWPTQLTGFTSRFNDLNTSASSGTGTDLSTIKEKYAKLHTDIKH